MNFGQAIKEMEKGNKVRCPEWVGYWYKKNGEIVVHLEDGSEVNTPWTGAMFRTDWEVAE